MSENKHTPGQITALSDQFVCHPASRSINEIEMAGEIMRDLLKHRDELLAALENCRLLAARHRKEEWAGHVLRFCGESGVAGEVMR